jgi:hypothetical protein
MAGQQLVPAAPRPERRAPVVLQGRQEHQGLQGLGVGARRAQLALRVRLVRRVPVVLPARAQVAARPRVASQGRQVAAAGERR